MNFLLKKSQARLIFWLLAIGFLANIDKSKKLKSAGKF
jgi:hypothetical protein